MDEFTEAELHLIFGKDRVDALLAGEVVLTNFERSILTPYVLMSATDADLVPLIRKALNG
jgi:hypothetical protein